MAGAQSRPLTDMHDVELAGLAALGGRREFGELVRRHSSMVRGLLRRMGAQPALADDLAQDAFMIAYEKCGAYRNEGHFGAWVGRIAARLYLRQMRKEARYVEALPDDVLETLEIDSIGRVDLDTALKALSEPERLCVSLCHGAGLTHEEIGVSLDLPLGTVKSHVKRGLDKLRARLLPAHEDSRRIWNVG